MNRKVLLMVAFLALPGIAGATNSQAELEGVMRDLLALMPGDYSSWPHIDMERRYGVPPDGEHEDWYRTFALIKAPQIGEHVLYGELRIGGPDGPLVKGSQVLYNVKIDGATHTVLANGRRIRNPEQFERAHERPDTWSRLEFDPAFGGSCDFRWTRHGAQVHGILNHDGTCHITSRVSGKKMMFDAEWTLTPTELWLFDNNYVLGQGPNERTLFLGREDRTHLRLYKVRWFDCDAGGKSYRLHDRGQEAALGDATDANRLRLLRGFRVLPGEQVLSEVMSLTLSDANGALLSESLSAVPASTTISLQAGGITASCHLSP